jgi:hypothetical protein
MHSRPRHIGECELSASHSSRIKSMESEKILYKSFRVSSENRLLASSCPSLRMHKLCWEWNDFHEISNRRRPSKCPKKPNFLKIGQKYTCYTKTNCGLLSQMTYLS